LEERIAMSDFALAFEHTMSFEDDPQHPGKVTHDAGGRTRFGIANKFHPGLPEEFWTGPADEARAQAETIELEQYWRPLSLDDVEAQAVASKIFDMGVNMGVHQAAILSQRAVNFVLSITGAQALPPATRLTEDGVIGSTTLLHLNSLDPADVLKTLRAFADAYYRHIVGVNPSQAVNLDGWLRRAAV